MKFRHVVIFVACLVATYAIEEMNSQKKKAEKKENHFGKMGTNWSAGEMSGLN